HRFAAPRSAAKCAHKGPESFFHRRKSSSARKAPWPAAAHAAIEARFAILIVHAAPVLIAEYLIGFRDEFELRLCFRVVWIAVRMEFESLFAIGFLDLFGAGIA